MMKILLRIAEGILWVLALAMTAAAVSSFFLFVTWIERTYPYAFYTPLALSVLFVVALAGRRSRGK